MIRAFGWNEFLVIVAAAQWTIALSAIAFAGGSVGGLLVALMRVADTRALRLSATGFIRVFQGTPLLMQLFLVFFGMNIFGFAINPWIAATIALALHASAFLGEIWRGCIEAVPKGQREAATVSGGPYRRRAHRRLPGATHKGHIARIDHRLYRADPARADHQQCDVQSVPGLRHRCHRLFSALLAAVADRTSNGDPFFPRNGTLTGPTGGRAGF